MNTRSKNEITHGKYLAEGNTELIWGWGTPAGRLRAQRRANLITTGAKLGTGIRVLEIGCGTGMFTEMFISPGAFIEAIDISEELLIKARARRLPEDQVCFVKKRFEDCDVDSPYDAIVGSSILHHLDIHEALPIIFRLLKSNGILCLAEPNMLNPQIWAERRFRWLFQTVSPDETAFIRWKLNKILEETGFQQIKIVPFDWMHPSVPRILVGLVSRMGRIFEAVPILREFSGSLFIKAIRP
ncbi:MAG: hypothetical protein QG578_1552 [Thermodesulfobacteriota bacterium]|nr:hypothetical protein [Thermodesulfobacteriota bacterium]